MRVGAKVFGAVALGLLVCATAFSPVPASAQLGFSLGFEDDDDDGFFFPRRFCVLPLTDWGLRQAVDDEGYDDIFLNVPIGRYVQVRATRGDWVYLLRVDICTGDIVERDRLRRANNDDDQEDED